MQIIAINRTCDPQTLLETMRSGIREFLSPPFEHQALLDALDRTASLVAQTPPIFETTDSVFAFLPAKAGSGATTIAVNTSLALSKMPDTNVLLADMDLNSGLVGFMLLLNQSTYSIVDAAENALELDENLWPKIVSNKDGLDVLPVGKLSPGFRIEAAQIRHILDYARRHYTSIFVDLSGMMEKYSVEILHESKLIYLVSTSELPSLHLCREKLSLLRSQDLGDRVRILLNRSQKRGQISLEEMEKLFGMPVHMTFPNDYAGVHAALTAGKQVDLHRRSVAVTGSWRSPWPARRLRSRTASAASWTCCRARKRKRKRRKRLSDFGCWLVSAPQPILPTTKIQHPTTVFQLQRSRSGHGRVKGSS